MKKLLLVALLVVSNAYANESADAMCDLYKAKAELSSSILGAPYIYGNTNEANTASMGIAYSLAGRNKAQLEKDISDARCSSVASTSKLDEQQKWALVSVSKAGARAETALLLKARELAKEHTDLVEKQLKIQAATINEYNSAKQVILAIENRITSNRTLLAEPSLPVDINNLQELLSKAKASEGQVAELVAKQEAQNAWDVSVSAGAQKDLLQSTSSVEPFVGLSFRWSFGGLGASTAVANIKNKTEAAFAANQSGYVKNSNRLLEKIDELLAIDKYREELLSTSINDNQRVLESFKDINTALALVTKTNINVQTLIYRAELAGVRARIDKLSGMKK